MIEGMGKEQPTKVAENGAKQSDIPYAFHLIDAHAIMKLAQVLYHGAKKYGVDNWRGISSAEHVNHAIAHFYAFLANDDQDDHLEHAFCRSMMALAVDLAAQRQIENILKATDWGKVIAEGHAHETSTAEAQEEKASILKEMRGLEDE